MKIGKYLLGLTLAIGLSTNAQEADECTRYKAIAGNAYKVKNYVKVTWAYNKAQEECESLDLKFYNPYIYSVKMAKRNAPDNETKAAYLDTLIMVYESAQKSHGVREEWQSYLGYSYLSQGKPGYMEKADAAYAIGIHHDGPKANEGMLKQYYANIYNLWVQEKDEEKKSTYKKRLITEFFTLSEYINGGDMNPEVLDFLNTYLDKAVTNCDSILPEISKFMNQLPSNLEAKKSSVNNFMELLENKDCTSSKEYEMLVDTIIDIDPSIGAVIAKAKLLRAKNKTNDAVKVYKEALELAQEEDEKSDIELAIAQTYFDGRNYKSAYSAGVAVSGENSKKGYAIAAKSVNASMNDCGASTFDRKANNYYAVELAEKAGDSRLADAYKKQCPTSSDIFNETLEVGDEIKLDCWGKTFKIVIY